MFVMVVMMMVLASIVAKLENKVMLAKAVEPAVILEALPCPLYSTVELHRKERREKKMRKIHRQTIHSLFPLISPYAVMPLISFVFCLPDL